MGWRSSRIGPTRNDGDDLYHRTPEDFILQLEGYQLLELGGLIAVHRLPEIPVALQAKPEIGWHTKSPCQSEGRIWRYRAASFNDLIEPRKGNAKTSSEGRLGETQGFDELGSQHFSWIRWSPLGRQAARDRRACPLSGSR